MRVALSYAVAPGTVVPLESFSTSDTVPAAIALENVARTVVEGATDEESATGQRSVRAGGVVSVTEKTGSTK